MDYEWSVWWKELWMKCVMKRIGYFIWIGWKELNLGLNCHIMLLYYKVKGHKDQPLHELPWVVLIFLGTYRMVPSFFAKYCPLALSTQVSSITKFSSFNRIQVGITLFSKSICWERLISRIILELIYVIFGFCELCSPLKWMTFILQSILTRSCLYKIILKGEILKLWASVDSKDQNFSEHDDFYETWSIQYALRDEWAIIPILMLVTRSKNTIF